MPTQEEYDREFLEEACAEYPALDEYERSAGFKLERKRLEEAARVLACPVKINPACWQHGRLLYAAVRRYLIWWEVTQEGTRARASEHRCFLDIGTAKGFSALMMQYAVNDSIFVPLAFPVVSVDVIDPLARVRRNTPAEVTGLCTLAEILRPWPAAERITFLKSSGREWLRSYRGRICLAFIDGKHTFAEVEAELSLLANHQRHGDVIVLDDLQIEGVAKALEGFRHAYDWVVIEASPSKEPEVRRARGPRRYAVALRR